MVVKDPAWFKTNNTKPALYAVRDRMAEEKKTLAIKVRDSNSWKWWLVRVLKCVAEDHLVEYGGEGGEVGQFRLVGDPDETGLTEFVFLDRRSAGDSFAGMSSRYQS